MSMLTTQDKLLGMFLGMAVGDAKGIPFELMTYEQIKNLGPITDNFKKTENHPFLGSDHPAGLWTDDTQLSIAIANALIENEEFNMYSIAKYHVKAYLDTTAGWGGTRTAIQKLSEKTHTYKNCGNPEAKGNGVIMKIAPLVFFYQQTLPHLTEKEFTELELVTRMTHSSKQLVMASAFHAQMLFEIFGMKSDQLDSLQRRISMLEYAVEVAKNLETKYFDYRDYSNPLDAIPIKENLLSVRMQLLLDRLKQKKRLDDADLIEISKQGDYYVVNSLTMVYGVLAAEAPTFQSIVRAVVIGGDTDSNASMVGTVVGVLKGEKSIDKTHVDHLQKSAIVISTAKNLALVIESIQQRSSTNFSRWILMGFMLLGAFLNRK